MTRNALNALLKIGGEGQVVKEDLWGSERFGGKSKAKLKIGGEGQEMKDG